jgi:hypothetical protein
MSKFKFIYAGGKTGGEKLIKLFRGETTIKNSTNLSGLWTSKEAKKYKGRWFSPDKKEAKYFSNAEDKSQKGNRILKTVTVPEKDYNIGNKLYKKVFGANHCRGDHCLLPKKNLRGVKSRKFNLGGLTKYYEGMV